jgi:hypothetical protein
MEALKMCWVSKALLSTPPHAPLILGEAIGCTRIVAEHPLKEGDPVLAPKVRHIIQLPKGNIVDDDFAIVVPLLDSPTDTFTHGLTATTDINNIRPELRHRLLQREGSHRRRQWQHESYTVFT